MFLKYFCNICNLSKYLRVWRIGLQSKRFLYTLLHNHQKYKNGSVALIRETGFDYDGAVYAVVCNSQTYIKRVYREEHGLRLVSINSNYQDIFLSYDEDPRIVGIIVGNFVPMRL